MAEEKVKLRLQGHEKFALREGWLFWGKHQMFSCVKMPQISLELEVTW